MVEIEVTGLEDLRASLAAREARITGNILKEAFREGANTLADTIRSLAPKKTGYMVNQLEVRATRRRDGATASVVFPTKSFPGFPYANVQEKGWFAGSRKALNRKWVKGTGFMQKALLQHQQDVPEAIVERIKEAIEADK